MNLRMQATLLEDGRLHLNDGPIDLIVLAEGDGSSRETAFAAAIARFSTMLDELCAELPLLRSQSRFDALAPIGVVARRMHASTLSLADDKFITPMAAVAGAVADEILSRMLRAAPLRRAYVNNGGDIALYLSGDATLTIGVVDVPEAPSIFGVSALDASHSVGGVATSGWRGRSFSLGIADAVTALAANAAQADAAATLIANAVDLPGQAAIIRAPANEIDPQSDLGDRLVTRSVGALSENDVACALASGEDEARRLIGCGAIVAASLRLCGVTRVVGSLAARSPGAERRPASAGAMLHGLEERKWRRTFASL